MLEENTFLKVYMDAIHFGGSKCYDLLRMSSTLRDDDFIMTSVGFSK